MPVENTELRRKYPHSLLLWLYYDEKKKKKKKNKKVTLIEDSRYKGREFISIFPWARSGYRALARGGGLGAQNLPIGHCFGSGLKKQDLMLPVKEKNGLGPTVDNTGSAAGQTANGAGFTN